MDQALEHDDVPLLSKRASHMSAEEYRTLLTRAFNAGVEAAKLVPPPVSVIVGQAHGKPIWGWNMYGRTGQAWISFPINSPFVQYLRKEGYGSNVPAGGYGIFVRYGGQDGVCKRAYALAFASVLRNAGIIAHAHVLMD